MIRCYPPGENSTGLFFNDCPQDELNKAGGTWHWLERTEEM